MEIPSSLSTEQLEALLQSASSDKNDEKPALYANKTQRQVMDIAIKYMNGMMDECPHPMVGKAALVLILNHMIEWHTKCGVRSQQDGEDSYVYWLRDAGKFQSMLGTLIDINVCNDDFLRE